MVSRHVSAKWRSSGQLPPAHDTRGLSVRSAIHAAAAADWPPTQQYNACALLPLPHAGYCAAAHRTAPRPHHPPVRSPWRPQGRGRAPCGPPPRVLSLPPGAAPPAEPAAVGGGEGGRAGQGVSSRDARLQCRSGAGLRMQVLCSVTALCWRYQRSTCATRTVSVGPAWPMPSTWSS